MVKTETFRGRDFITLLDYTKEEIETLLEVALDLKRKFATGEPHKLLDAKTLFNWTNFEFLPGEKYIRLPIEQLTNAEN